jgi:hypothetical protein
MHQQAPVSTSLCSTKPCSAPLPAGSGARAHGLRAKAGAPFLSFFLSFSALLSGRQEAAVLKLAASSVGQMLSD